MNIKPLTGFYLPRTNNNTYENQKYHTVLPNMRLKNDQVSFTHSIFKDTLEQQHELNRKKYEKYAEKFFDVLENIADKFSENGVSFDREYAMQNPIKSATSMSSKISRSGSLDVPDLIRTTIYMKNPYDTNFINNEFLPAMEEHGYVLAKVNGKPDIDFRLEGLGRPQASGYEDIQMRFVKKDDKQKKVKHELIVLFGPNYAEAKHTESEKVYNIIRQFDELHMDFTDAPFGSHQFKADRYIQLIKTQAQNKISKKLFDNAKNKDFYKIDDVAPISFTPENKAVLKNYFLALHDRTLDYYKTKKKQAQNSEIALIQLKKDEQDDLTLIKYIGDMLKASIKYFEMNQQ